MKNSHSVLTISILFLAITAICQDKISRKLEKCSQLYAECEQEKSESCKKYISKKCSCEKIETDTTDIYGNEISADCIKCKSDH